MHMASKHQFSFSLTPYSGLGRPYAGRSRQPEPPAAAFPYFSSARSLAAFLLPLSAPFFRSALASAILPVSL